MKRLLLTLGLLAAPLWVGAGAELETAGTAETINSAGRVIEWKAADGPVDSQPLKLSPANPIAGLIVHEWGTFTSVAGRDGHAMEWLPAGGPTDLPCFVAVSGGANASVKTLPVGQQGQRASRGRIRMETPVIYFYSTKKEVVNVKVSFPRGLISEWYPPAVVGTTPLGEGPRAYPNVTGKIEWNNVTITPGGDERFIMEAGPSHYYAARATDAAPLEVPVLYNNTRERGSLSEKFLFYRGIADFAPPIAVRYMPEGHLAVTNVGERALPAVIAFENRGGKVGFRIHRNLSGTVNLAPPPLAGSLKALQSDLEAILQEEGMYPLEARAMVDTWRDTWFEQGSRVFYIVPAATVDELLPLEVTPKPLGVARAFVGRMEVITPASQDDVLAAIRNNDRMMLETYGRFLEPIVDHFLTGRLTTEEASREASLRKSIRESYVAAVAACSKGHNW